MTRDEAIRKARQAWAQSMGATVGEDLVNVLIALGMLKLEEPKSMQERLRESFNEGGFPVGYFLATLRAIERAGFKIVEK